MHMVRLVVAVVESVYVFIFYLVLSIHYVGLSSFSRRRFPNQIHTDGCGRLL